MSKKRKIMDEYPNFISGVLALSGANTFTTQQVFTPIPRLKVSGNKATVMELLWVDTEWEGTDIVASGDFLQVGMSIGAVPTAVLSLSDPRTIITSFQEFSALTSGGNFLQTPLRSELQSTDGFGALLASDAFHVSALTGGMAGASSVHWRVYYRFVEITVAEFVGLVQSTQQS